MFVLLRKQGFKLFTGKIDFPRCHLAVCSWVTYSCPQFEELQIYAIFALYKSSKLDHNFLKLYIQLILISPQAHGYEILRLSRGIITTIISYPEFSAFREGETLC